MKIVPLKKLLLSNATLKTISLFLSYSLWHIATIDQTIETKLTVPLFFSYTKDAYIIDAPEKIDIILQGKRRDLYALDQDLLAAHIDSSTLSLGKNGIILKEHHLFLPNTIVLLYYRPSNLTITLTDTNPQKI